MSLNRLRSGGTLANSPATKSAWGVGVRLAGSTATGGGASYLLDTYTALTAYSVRLISSTATNCMLVREDGGGTEAAIGFSSGWVDGPAIIAHCTTNNGYVKTWYDQSGNGYDVSQTTTTKQPQIFNGSAVLTQGGKAALFFDQGTDHLLSTTSVVPSTAQPVQYFWVATNLGGSGNDYICQTPTHKFGYQGDRTFYGFAGSTYTTPESHSAGQILGNFLANGAGSLYRNSGTAWTGGDAGASASGSGLFAIGNDSGLDALEYAQEFIMFASDLSANNAAIESDLATAFGISLP